MSQLPPFTHLVGAMLGAQHLYVSGTLVETTDEQPDGRKHQFWSHGKKWRVERSDGLVFVDAPPESITLSNGRLQERGPAHHPGFHLPERLLRPQFAPIWGRPADDWRFNGEVQEVGSGVDLVGLPLTHMEDDSQRGVAEVDLATGRIHALRTPRFTWELLDLSEESGEDLSQLFDLA